MDEPPPPQPVNTTVAVNNDAAITLIILVFLMEASLNCGFFEFPKIIHEKWLVVH
jgi:hypothetical protein